MTPYDYAKGELGTLEWGDGDNPEILKYYQAGGHNISNDEVPWCSAFVNWCEQQAGNNGTGKLNARSYLNYGVEVSLEDARPGDILVFRRGNSSWQGHVAYYAGHSSAMIKCLGGNQADAVNYSNYSKAKLLGVRRMAPSATANWLTVLIEMIMNMFRSN